MAPDALKWISSLLYERDIPFVICGGLAAIAYGSRRELNDIDLFVPGENFQAVAALGAEFISKPPLRYRGEGWDVEYVQFTHGATKIEIGSSAGVKIYDAGSDAWVDLVIDFEKATRLAVLGIEVPVMSVEELVSYKIKLDRDVDREDVAQLARYR